MGHEKGMQYKKLMYGDVISNYEMVFKEYSWTYQELMCTPMGAYFDTINAMVRRFEREIKAHKDAMKKVKRKWKWQ